MTKTESLPFQISVKQTPVFDGETPFIMFHVVDEEGKDKIIGKLWGTGGRLSFEGDAEASAKVFFDEVIELNRHALMPPGVD